MKPSTRAGAALSLTLALLLASAPQAGAAQLELAAPGQAQYVGDKPPKAALAPWIAARRWQALALRDGALVLTPATELGPSGTLAVQGKNADRLRAGQTVPPRPDGKALKLPPDALFALRLSDDAGAALPLPAGPSASALAPAVLEQGWRASVSIGGAPWTLAARSQTRPDGRMLAGSLEIVATPNGGAEQVLLPVAGGMAFARQELLWLGDLDGDAQPDLVLRRTRLTGDVGYVMVLGHERRQVAIADATTAHYFSSGVEPESNGFSWPAQAPIPAPFLLARQGGFTIKGEDWLRELATPPALPKILAERQYKLQGETIRFTLEYVPRVSPELGWGSEEMWSGPVVVRVFFRGKSQVLMEAAAPDDDNFTLSFGLQSGKAAILIDYHPHYNNGLQYHWVFDGERFARVLAIHEQGC